jgi:hypothetical protein
MASTNMISVFNPNFQIVEEPPSTVEAYGFYNCMLITMEIHYGGYFIGNADNVYIDGKIKYAVSVNIHTLTCEKLRELAEDLLGIKGNIAWFNKVEGESLECGLVHLHSESDIERYKRRVFPNLCNTVQVMYIDQAPSTVRSFWPEALLWEGEKNELFPHMLACFRANSKVTFDEACNELETKFFPAKVPLEKLIVAWEKAGFFFEEYKYDLPFWDYGEV